MHPHLPRVPLAHIPRITSAHVPHVPGIPHIPWVSHVPGIPHVPWVPHLPRIPHVPRVPHISHLPWIARVSRIPHFPLPVVPRVSHIAVFSWIRHPASDYVCCAKRVSLCSGSSMICRESKMLIGRDHCEKGRKSLALFPPMLLCRGGMTSRSNPIISCA